MPLQYGAQDGPGGTPGSVPGTAPGVVCFPGPKGDPGGLASPQVPAAPAPTEVLTTGTTKGTTGATSQGYRKAVVVWIDKATTAGDTAVISIDQVYLGFQVTDAVISGTTNLQSTIGGFTAAMAGQLAVAPGIIPAGTTVTFVDAHNLTLSAASTNGACVVDVNPTIKTTGVHVKSYTPGDNGGDTSAGLYVQTGGGCALTAYKTAGLKPPGTPDRSSSQQGAFEAATDGGSQAIIAISGLSIFGIAGHRSAAVYARIDNSVSDGVLIAPNDAVFDNRLAWVVGNKNNDAAPTAVTSKLTLIGDLTVRSVAVGGLPGSGVASRFVGATASGAPTTGAHNKGDVSVAQDGHLFICTVAGTPGTWVDVGVGV